MRSGHGIGWLARPRRIRVIGLVSVAVGLAACSTGSTSTGAQAAHRPVQVLATSGDKVTRLWQGAVGNVLATAGGLVIGTRYAHGHYTVRAVSALTGAPVWTLRPPRAEQGILGMIAGAGVLVAEISHTIGRPPLAVTLVVGRYMVLDARTGKILWTAPVPGRSQQPPLAIAGGAVVSGGGPYSLIARQATTGRVLWRRPAPAGCPGTGPGAVIGPWQQVGVAADGPLLAASFVCSHGRLIVQRLAATTGKLIWQWEAPSVGSTVAEMSVTGVARQGQLILLTGQVTPPAAARALARTVPRPYTWPARFGPIDIVEVVLALDAATGHPRWIELGGQLQEFSLADGAVCESVNIGLECRDDITGAPTRPLLVTGQPVSAVPPNFGDGFAGISGSEIAVTVAPFRAGHVRLVVLPVRGDGQLAHATLDIGFTAQGAGYRTFVVGASALPGGATMVLLRRIDQPGYPLVALKVAAAHPS